MVKYSNLGNYLQIMDIHDPLIQSTIRGYYPLSTVPAEP
jgi:hypothetical protein